MATSAAKLSFRIVIAIVIIATLFYMGRPLYWKISATVQEIRANRQTVKQGLTQFVYEAQKLGWWHDESDSGVGEDKGRRVSVSRRLLF